MVLKNNTVRVRIEYFFFIFSRSNEPYIAGIGIKTIVIIYKQKAKPIDTYCLFFFVYFFVYKSNIPFETVFAERRVLIVI